MTVAETSKFLKVTRSYVYRLIKRGDLKIKKQYPLNIDNLSIIDYSENRRPRGRPRHTIGFNGDIETHYKGQDPRD